MKGLGCNAGGGKAFRRGGQEDLGYKVQEHYEVEGPFEGAGSEMIGGT